MSRTPRAAVIVLLASALVGLLAAERGGAAGGTGATYFGFNENIPGIYITPERGIELTHRVGGNMLRGTVDWRIMEPRRDEWLPGGWDYHQGIYQQILDAGIKPIIIIGYAPSWARTKKGRRCGDDCLYPPQNSKAMNQEWGEFAAQAARTFPEAVIEVWNEANWATFYAKPNPRRYAKLLAIADRAIHRVNPEIPVLASGLAGIMQNVTGSPKSIPFQRFLKKAYRSKHDLAAHADGLNVHFLSQEDIEVTRQSSTARRYRKLMRLRRRFDHQVPIWVTELGISTGGPKAVSEQQQADALINLSNWLGDKESVETVLVTGLVERGISDWERGLSVMRGTADQPKPAYCALVARAGNQFPGC